MTTYHLQLVQQRPSSKFPVHFFSKMQIPHTLFLFFPKRKNLEFEVYWKNKTTQAKKIMIQKNNINKKWHFKNNNNCYIKCSNSWRILKIYKRFSSSDISLHAYFARYTSYAKTNSIAWAKTYIKQKKSLLLPRIHFNFKQLIWICLLFVFLAHYISFNHSK